MQVSVVINIGKKTDLSDAVKSEIVKSIANGMRFINIGQEMCLDYRTFKKYVQDSEYQWKKSDKGSLRKITSQKLNIIGRQLMIKPLDGIQNIFWRCLCSWWPKIIMVQGAAGPENCTKMPKTPTFKCFYWENSLEWMKKYLKHNFYHILFTDEYWATLYGPVDVALNGTDMTSLNHLA